MKYLRKKTYFYGFHAFKYKIFALWYEIEVLSDNNSEDSVYLNEIIDKMKVCDGRECRRDSGVDYENTTQLSHILCGFWEYYSIIF